MIWTDIIMGVILMLIGLLVERYPMLISGINTMSKERLSKVDLDGLKHAFRNVMLIGGAVLLLLGGLSALVHIPEGLHFALMMAVVAAIVIVGILLSRRYDAGLQGEEGKKERREGRIAIIITVVPIIAILIFFFIGTKPAKIEVSSDCIKAKGGGYSASIPMTDIATTSVLSEWPNAVRTNGVGTDRVDIGHFRLKNGEKCMMFLCVEGGPAFEVRTVDGKLYYLNCATEEETFEMIAKVKQQITENP